MITIKVMVTIFISAIKFIIVIKKYYSMDISVSLLYDCIDFEYYPISNLYLFSYYLIITTTIVNYLC